MRVNAYGNSIIWDRVPVIELRIAADIEIPALRSLAPAISRTPPPPGSRLECQGRRLSTWQRNPGRRCARRKGAGPSLLLTFLGLILNEAAPPSAVFRGWEPNAACIAQVFYPFALHWTRQGQSQNLKRLRASSPTL